MSVFWQNKCSSIGLFLGAIALLVSVFHFSLGPFSPPAPRLESYVAKQTIAIKKGLIAGLAGKEVQEAPEPRKYEIDDVLDSAGIGLAILALICAFIGGMCKENRWSVRGALFFGGGTLAFHALVFGIAIICAILLLMFVVSVLTGSSPF